ncbi:hypothetical protein [Virgibacillus profundi]|uniref:hypothetical protein n=1 Tax=Virgibacillus profundi TaxID=2024555 RepID=UPI0013FDCD4B|nr:hypothetical protein [Virgibacillus profundi]
MFGDKSLKCTVCNKNIEVNESIVVELKLPSQLKMPYGMLDAALRKQADRIICSNCKL